MITSETFQTFLSFENTKEGSESSDFFVAQKHMSKFVIHTNAKTTLLVSEYESLFGTTTFTAVGEKREIE